MHKLNFIIHGEKIALAMKAKGIHTIEELSKQLNVHRNTILPYLSGQRALPDCLDRMLKLLDIAPGDAIVKNVKSKIQPGLEISPLISQLVTSQPKNAYVLFGSRAKRTNKKYSDYDIGIYRINNLPFSELSKLIDLTEEWKSNKSYDVNVTNLSLADIDFLHNIQNDWIFLGGNLEAWIDLQKKIGIELYE